MLVKPQQRAKHWKTATHVGRLEALVALVALAALATLVALLALLAFSRLREKLSPSATCRQWAAARISTPSRIAAVLHGGPASARHSRDGCMRS